MKPLHLYLAGPMRRYSEFNFPAFFATEATLQDLGVEVYNPARRDVEHAGFDPAGMTGFEDLAELGFNLRASLADDLAFIALESDGICVLPGWSFSSGAVAEVAVARALDLPIFMVVYDELGTPALSDITKAAYGIAPVRRARRSREVAR